MNIDQIVTGGIYDNGRGRQRKVLGFRRTWGSPIQDKKPDQYCDVVYEFINGPNAGKQSSCWTTSFRSWAKSRVDGTQDELVSINKRRLAALDRFAEAAKIVAALSSEPMNQIWTLDDEDVLPLIEAVQALQLQAD